MTKYYADDGTHIFNGPPYTEEEELAIYAGLSPTNTKGFTIVHRDPPTASPPRKTSQDPEAK